MYYTETIGERTTFNLAIPQQLTATNTINSNKADLSKCERAFFRFITGAFTGTSPTLSAALALQVSVDGTTWVPLSSTSNQNVTATVTTAQTEQGMEVRADQLTQQSAVDGLAANAGYRYARLQAVCTIAGTSPVIQTCMDSFMQNGSQGPASQSNVTGILPPLQVVSL